MKSVCVFRVAVLVCTSAIGDAANPPETPATIAQRRFQAGQKAEQQNDYIRAESEYREVLGVSLEQLGASFDKLGLLSKAEGAYREAISAASDSDAALFGLSVVYLKKGESQKGIDTVHTLLAQRPSDAPARSLLGKLYFSANRYDAAALEFQEALIKWRRDEQLIFITGHGNIPMCAQAMKAGAIDFLPKPFKPHQLLQCVERALARSIDQRRAAADKNNARRLLDELTPREFQVMQLITTGMLNKQIAGELGTAEKTVKVHRGRVMQKLRIGSVAELVRLVEKAGVVPFAPSVTVQTGDTSGFSQLVGRYLD